MDKARKRELKRQWEASQRAIAKPIELPLATDALWKLLDHLEDAVPAHGCNHTHRLATAWIESQGYSVENVVAWLRANGMYCDCEIVLNIEPYLRHAEGEG